MKDQELEIISLIAKTLMATVPGIPMEVATRYAKKIHAALRDASHLS